MADPFSTYGIIGLILSNVGVWVREYFKDKDWKLKNGAIERIEGAIKKIFGQQERMAETQGEMAGSIGKIETELGGINKTCERFDKEINQNRRDILSLEKHKADKK